MHLESAHVHREQGLLGDEPFGRWRIAAGWYAGFPGVQTWWANRRVIFTREFREFVDREAAKRGPTDPADWTPHQVSLR